MDTPGVRNPDEHNKFYRERLEVLKFVYKFGEKVFGSQAKEARKIGEKLVDMLGILRFEAMRRGDEGTGETLDEIALGFFPEARGKGRYESLVEFVGSSYQRLQRAVDENRAIVFVMGHKNPDTDTVISCLFEAYRNSVINPGVCYVPVVQAERMPDEIKRLLGKTLSRAFMVTADPVYKQAEGLGQTRWALVDHNRSEKQKFVLSIVDHHILSGVARRQDVPKTWEMVGSCSAQIAQKLFGIGIVPDSAMSRLLHGATLMDTENRGPKKMTYRDILIMDTLKGISRVSDEEGFYQDLMSQLLNTNDARRLFERDYKEDWGIFGFAVAKVKGAFDESGVELKPRLMEQLVELAHENNRAKNLCMTIVKVVDYEGNNESVGRERIYLVFNDFASPEFREVIFECMEKIIRFQLGENVGFARLDSGVEFWGAGDQLSRKVTAPEIEPVVAAFNEFYYSGDLNLFAKREFLELDEDVAREAKELGIKIYQDREGRVCNVTYKEAKRLVERLGYKMLSLSEYWRILGEAHNVNDVQMQRHLVSPGFVEFLDTIIVDYRSVVDHPEISGEEYTGDLRQVDIPEALPALIYQSDIDPKTGFPIRTYVAQEKYADPETWRYWSPDAPVAVATRGYIFLLEKAALDLKIHPDDALPNLGIRVVAERVTYPRVEFEEKKGKLEIRIVKV